MSERAQDDTRLGTRPDIRARRLRLLVRLTEWMASELRPAMSHDVGPGASNDLAALYVAGLVRSSTWYWWPSEAGRELADRSSGVSFFAKPSDPG